MQNTNFLDCVGKAHRSDSEIARLQTHIRETNLLSGDSDLVTHYESALATHFQMPHATAVSSGTAGLHATLAQLIQPGDEVLLPVIGVSMTAIAILAAGGIPVFYDCQPDSFKPDIDSLERFRSDKTRVLITVSMWGYPAIDSKIISYAKQSNLIVLEDTAQGFGTKHEGEWEGTRGQVGCFSTQEFKLLSTGEGGFVLTHDISLGQRIREFVHLGFSKKHMGFGHQMGLNYRLSGIQSSLGISQLEQAEDKIRIRQAKTQAWRDGLSSCKMAEMSQNLQFQHNGYALCLRMSGLKPGDAKMIRKELFDVGVHTDIHRYKQGLIHHFPFLSQYAHDARYKRNDQLDFPNSTQLMDELLTLPAHDGVSLISINTGVEKVLQVLNAW